MTKEEALTLEALKYAASLGNGRIVREMNTAPFIIRCEEALAQPEKPEHEPVGDLLRDFAEQYIKEDEAVVSSINRLMTLGRKMSDAILFAPPQRQPLTDEQAKMIFRMARELEDTGRLTSLSEGAERQVFVRKNRDIQCALEDYLRNLTGATPPPQPQRPWVGLTEEETDNIRFSIPATHHTEFDRKFTRAIEAKLKEKNT